MTEEQVPILPEVEGVKTCEISIQTPTHVMESYKDPKYSWNEWELRRRAIQTVPIDANNF